MKFHKVSGGIKRFAFSLAVVVQLLAAEAWAGTESVDFPVSKFTLPNGLTVLVVEDSRTPLVSFQQWFRVGSSYEKVGRTGLAHFFEHLMFKGTKKYPEHELDRVIQANGGNYNAFTTEDLTGYYINIPSDKLELVMQIEADRMRNLEFTQDKIDREREVVKEERRLRYENSVWGSLREKITHVVFRTSPYRWPVIGYMKDLNAAKLEEFKEFYDTYYVPSNAVIVVAGAVSESKVRKLIEKYYGEYPRTEVPAFQPTPEAPQNGAREGVIEKDVESVTAALVYRAVPAGHPDALALDLLASVLGGGNSSRLYKRLVYKNQLLSDVSASSEADRLAGTFSVYLPMKPGADDARAVALVDDEIRKLQKELVAPEELEKVRNFVVLNYVLGLETVAEKAQSLAQNEIMFGDYKILFDDYKKYQAVTREDLQRVAKTYLVRSQRSLVKVVPKK